MCENERLSERHNRHWQGVFLSSEAGGQPVSCLHPRIRRAKCQVESLPEQCSHPGPLSLLLSLSFSSCVSAAFSLLFGADAGAAVCCKCAGERTPHTHLPTHTYSHSNWFSRSTIESKTQKLLSLHFFYFFLVGVSRDSGWELKCREGNGEGGETMIGKKQSWYAQWTLLLSVKPQPCIQ